MKKYINMTITVFGAILITIGFYLIIPASGWIAAGILVVVINATWRDKGTKEYWVHDDPSQPGNLEVKFSGKYMSKPTGTHWYKAICKLDKDKQ